MSEITNENEKIGQAVDNFTPLLATTTEETSGSPKLINTRVINIETKIYDDGQQVININTPNGSTVAENVGMLDIAKHILLKDKF